MLRLVARGTIEELKYCRQVYKEHLNQETLGTSKPGRMFHGVASDPNRKGELFGCENLLKFKDGSFMDDLWLSSENTKGKIDDSNKTHDVSKLATLMKDNSKCLENVLKEDEEEEILDSIEKEISGMKGCNHEDFLHGDRGVAAIGSGGMEIQGSQMYLEDLGMNNMDTPKNDVQHSIFKTEKSDSIELINPSAEEMTKNVKLDFSKEAPKQKQSKKSINSTSLLRNMNLLQDRIGSFKSTAIIYRPAYLEKKINDS